MSYSSLFKLEEKPFKSLYINKSSWFILHTERYMQCKIVQLRVAGYQCQVGDVHDTY